MLAAPVPWRRRRAGGGGGRDLAGIWPSPIWLAVKSLARFAGQSPKGCLGEGAWPPTWLSQVVFAAISSVTSAPAEDNFYSLASTSSRTVAFCTAKLCLFIHQYGLPKSCTKHLSLIIPINKPTTAVALILGGTQQSKSEEKLWDWDVRLL